jgi:N-methylhydantoinase B
MGAQAWRDGVHTGGVYWGPYHLAPNVEQVEQTSPVLYLRRGELIDGQGLGRFASGGGPTAAWTPYRTDGITLNIAACGMAVPTAPGIFGGLPGITNSVRVRKSDGSTVEMRPKEKNFLLRPGDIYEGWSSGGAGYGDPLLREPTSVAADVRDRYATAETAQRFYGVVLGENLTVLEPETVELRNRLLVERLGYPPRRTSGTRGRDQVLLRVADTLVVVDADGEPTFACAHCGERLGRASRGFKRGAETRVLPLESAGPLFRSASRFVDREFELRLYLCGGCGTLLETEVADREDEPVESMTLRIGSAK